MSATYRDKHESDIYGSRLIIFRGKEEGAFWFQAKIEGHYGNLTPFD